MPLPADYVVRLERHVRVVDGGAALLGGSPTRLVHLSAAARPLLRDRVVRADTKRGAALAERLLDLAMADPVVESLPAVDAEVTVVIPVKDRPRELARLLASIRGTGPGGATPAVIVVDDGSDRPGPVADASRRHGATLLPLDCNVGPAGARNAGLAAATTPFVLFVDSDVVLEPETLRTLLRHTADPRVAMVAPRILGLDDGGTWITRYEDARSSLDLGRFAAAVRPRSPVSWVSSSTLLVRTEVLRGLGVAGFDDTMRVGEDVDLCWRLHDAGWRIRYEPTAIARHEHRATLRAWMARKAFYGSGADALARRHPDEIVPAILAPWSVGVLVALLAQRRWSVPVAVGITAVAAERIARRLTGVRHPRMLAARLAAAGAGAAVSQGSALLVRHCWPLTLVGAIVSPRIRRAALVAAVADAALEYRRTPPRLDPVRFAVARRLDDLAYGAGVWWSALRGRSLAALRPDVSGRSPGTSASASTAPAAPVVPPR